MWVQGLSGLVLQDVQFKRDESLSIVRTHAILTTPGTVYILLGSCSPWMNSSREIKVYLLKELMLFLTTPGAVFTWKGSCSLGYSYN